MFYVRVLMEWTTETPTPLGWYWLWTGEEVYMVEVDEYSLPRNGFELVDEFLYFLPKYRYIGPLPEPEPPHAPN